MEKQTEFITTELKKFNVTDVAIKELNDQCMLLRIESINDNEGYKEVKSARLVVKGKRVDVEKKRKELKADALTFGRAVDGEAKRITALLTPIENYLSVMEKAVDDEKERIRFEKEQKAKLPLRRDKLIRLSVLITEEELLKMDDVAFANFYNKKREQRIEEEERILVEKEAKIQESERQIQEKQNELKRQEELRLAKEEAARQAVIDEKERAKNEIIKKEQEKVALEKKKRVEAEVLPDKEKVLIFAKTIEGLTNFIPEVKSEKYQTILLNAKKMLNKVSDYLKHN